MPISSDLVRHIQSNSSTFVIGAMVPTLAFNYFHCVKRVRMRSYSGPFGLNTEKYGEIRFISPYSVQMRENTDQNNSKYGHVSRSIYHANFLIFQRLFALFQDFILNIVSHVMRQVIVSVLTSAKTMLSQ